MSKDLLQESEFDLRAYFLVVLRRKWLVLGFAAAVTVIVAVISYMLPKIYEAKVAILVGREGPRLVRQEVIPQESVHQDDFLQNQAAILGSQAFLERVVKRLMDGGFYGKVSPAKREAQITETARRLQYQVRVVAMSNSQVLRATVRGSVPERVAKIADALADAFVDMDREKNREMARTAAAWLEKQLADQKVKMGQAESELQAFKEKENIVGGDEDDPFATAGLTRLNDEYMSARFQRIALETRIAALKRARAGAASGGSEGGTRTLDAEVQIALKDKLKEEYVDANLQLREMAQRYGPEHPDILTLRGKVSKIAQELQVLEVPTQVPAPETSAVRMEDLQTEYSIWLNKEKVLAQTLESRKVAVRNLSRTALRYTLLKQDVDLNRQTYDDLLSRLNGARLSGDLSTSTVMVLDRAAVPKEPVEPKPLQNTLAGAVAGLVLGIGLAMLLEHLDSRVKGPEDVARYLGLPILSVVPGMGIARGVSRKEGSAELVTIQEPRSQQSECYRNLRTSILFCSGRPVPRSILVTSAVPGEGKSTTAANLAVVMAQSSRRVLLVDADLRRPSLHRYFPRQAGRGLVRLLHENCPPEEAVQKSGLDGLDLLLCNEIPKDPSELLGSERMRGLIQKVGELYDVVIIDSPVLVSVPDAVILAARSEVVLLVHRPGAADRDMVQYAKQRLDEVKANILGIVLNNVEEKTGRYYYHSGYFYSGYGAEAGTPEPGPKRKQGK